MILPITTIWLKSIYMYNLYVYHYEQLIVYTYQSITAAILVIAGK